MGHSSTRTPRFSARSATRARGHVAELRRSDRAGTSQVRRDILAEVTANSIWRGTLTGRRRDGWCLQSRERLRRSAIGRPRHALRRRRTGHDDDLAMRDQLVHSERLSAIGELIAGVAHEINNPLQTIIGLYRAHARRVRLLELARSPARAQGSDARRPNRPEPAGVCARGESHRTPIDLNDLVRATAELPVARRRPLSSVVVMRAPVEPNGWPSAMAPPCTLSLSKSMPRSSALGSTCAANASLIS